MPIEVLTEHVIKLLQPHCRIRLPLELAVVLIGESTAKDDVQRQKTDVAEHFKEFVPFGKVGQLIL